MPLGLIAEYQLRKLKKVLIEKESLFDQCDFEIDKGAELIPTEGVTYKIPTMTFGLIKISSQNKTVLTQCFEYIQYHAEGSQLQLSIKDQIIQIDGINPLELAHILNNNEYTVRYQPQHF